MSVPATGAPKVLLFDVNETLLNLASVEESVNKVLLENNAAKLWFSNMLHYSLVLTVSGQYRPFPEIGAAVLQMMARNRDVMLSAEDASKALEPMKSAPAHADVPTALAALRSAGFRMATLTNSTCEGSKAQLDSAGIAGFFERQLSVETVKKYKPHRDVYLWAAEQMQVQPADCMLVAAHPWDVAGAAWAGMRAAFLARVGVQTFTPAPAPEIEALDLGDLARRLGAAPAAT
jgi:2-haloacid dehalogenase